MQRKQRLAAAIGLRGGHCSHRHIEEENLLQHASEVGEYFMTQLRSLAARMKASWMFAAKD